MNRILDASRLRPTHCPLLSCGLLLACCLLLAVPAWTDEPDGGDEPEATTPEPADESPRRDNTSFEVFVPSEQISEDIPVPFPVDI